MYSLKAELSEDLAEVSENIGNLLVLHHSSHWFSWFLRKGAYQRGFEEMELGSAL